MPKKARANSSNSVGCCDLNGVPPPAPVCKAALSNSENFKKNGFAIITLTEMLFHKL